MPKHLPFLLVLTIHTIVNAQTSQRISPVSEDGGIKFEQTLSWQQIRAKAQAENKYIFLDCFATWCGPCKLMDKNVYTNDTIGNYFNDKFISIKVQMDQTKKDNDYVRSWYEDAIALNKRYRVQGYPTLIFLSPSGTIVHQILGYQSVSDLIVAGQTATTAGQVYIDPFTEYDNLVNEYNKGTKNYDRMPYMIKTAYRLDEKEFGKKLLDEHTEYVAILPKENRYTKEAIEMWSGFLLGSDKKRFLFFYNDGDLIDEVIGKKGFAREVVNKTIQEEIVWPFLKEQSAGAKILVSPETMNLMDSSQKTDYREADWNRLYKAIKKKFDKAYAESNILEAKIKWYDRHKNYNGSTQIKLEKFENNPPDITDPKQLWIVNTLGWNTFINITDKNLLNGALEWMGRVIKYWGDTIVVGPHMIDTYANLLYKTGERGQAIEWETKAMRLADRTPYLKHEVSEYLSIINKMKKGEPTYVEKGAVWKE